MSAPIESQPWGNPSIDDRSGFTRCVAVGVEDTFLWGNPSGEESPTHPTRAPLWCDPDRRFSRTAPSRCSDPPYIPSAKSGGSCAHVSAVGGGTHVSSGGGSTPPNAGYGRGGRACTYGSLQKYNILLSEYWCSAIRLLEQFIFPVRLLAPKHYFMKKIIKMFYSDLTQLWTFCYSREDTYIKTIAAILDSASHLKRSIQKIE